MIKLNWIVILAIIALLILLYINNSEHFAGALTIQNAEAVANISSMVNSGKMKVSELEVTTKVSAPLTVNNGIVMQATDKDIHNISLSRSDEQDKNHTWSLWHMNQRYGQNDLSFWEYGHDKDGVYTNFNANMIIRSTKKDTGKSGGVSFLKGADFHGPVSFDGATSTPAGSGDGRTHFPNANGSNYIRGNTYVDGNTNISGNICIGSTCITEDHLKILTGQKPITLNRGVNGRDNGRSVCDNWDNGLLYTCNAPGQGTNWSINKV